MVGNWLAKASTSSLSFTISGGDSPSSEALKSLSLVPVLPFRSIAIVTALYAQPQTSQHAAALRWKYLLLTIRVTESITPLATFFHHQVKAEVLSTYFHCSIVKGFLKFVMWTHDRTSTAATCPDTHVALIPYTESNIARYVNTLAVDISTGG